MSLLSWLKRRRLDDEDFREEIRAHLAIAADERRASGEDPKSAQLASLKDFGNVSLTLEAARTVWTPWWLDALHDQASDVRYAIRALAKNPAFALARRPDVRWPCRIRTTSTFAIMTPHSPV